MKKKLISTLLVFIMLTCLNAKAFSAEGDIELYASAYLERYYVALSADGGGKMTLVVSVDGVGIPDKIGIQSIEIQQKINGDWQFYDEMDSVDHPEFYVCNSRDYFDSVEFYGTPGITYQVIVTVFAYKGSGGGTGHITSPAVVCK